MSGAAILSFLGSTTAGGQCVPQAVDAAHPLPVAIAGAIGTLLVTGTIANGAFGDPPPVVGGGRDITTGEIQTFQVDPITGGLLVYQAGGGGAVSVTDVRYVASGLAAVSSTFVATGTSASFTPLAGRAFNITLTGTFVATVQLERFLGGVWVPITAVGTQIMIWTAPASEQWSDDQNAVPYRLNCNAYTSGTVTYRLEQ